MKPEVIKHINNALDEILSEYKNDHHLIFDNDSERLGVYHRQARKKHKSWNNRKKCIYRGCTNKSIRRSHSIQKSGSLKVIARNSTVLAPEFNQKNGKIELVGKGLAQASVFPGFCEKHEALFNSFENNKNIESIETPLLQIYRSICREIVRLKHEIKFSEQIIFEYQNFRDKKLKRIMEEKLVTNWMKINNVKVNKFNVTEDPLISFFRNRYVDLKNTLEELENEHLREIEECLEINDENTEGTLSPLSISIDEQIPVALSGIGSFRVDEGNHSKRVLVVLMVFPNAKSTNIVIHGKSSDTEYFHGYLSKMKNSFDILNMVEQWMIRFTDHWFLSHDVWDKKKQIEKAIILKEFMDISKGPAKELNFSIFDDIRRSMIRTWKISGSIEKKEIEILNREQAKLQL